MGLDADVLVIGGGPAGCCAAVRLAQAGRDVLVLERRATLEDEDHKSGELMAPPTQWELDAIGITLEGPLGLDRVTAVRNVYPDLSYTLHPFPPGFAFVQVDRARLDGALQDRVVTVGGRLVRGAHVRGVEFQHDAAIARTADGREFRARIIIDAGGRHAPSLTALRLKAEEPEFQQIGVALFFATFGDLPLHTWDRHLHGTHGVMISGSQIRPGLVRVILEADLADKQATGMKPVPFYEETLRRYDPWWYARVMREPRTGLMWTMAPFAYCVPEVARDRLVLAGDATGYLSPFTGQGVEFAMRMGRLAAEAVHAALTAGDVSAGAFAGYVEERRAEVVSQMEIVRRMLRWLRDREALLRASTDDALRAEIFGPLFETAPERGSLG